MWCTYMKLILRTVTFVTTVSILYLVMYFPNRNVGTDGGIGMFLNLEIKFKRRFDLKKSLRAWLYEAGWPRIPAWLASTSLLNSIHFILIISLWLYRISIPSRLGRLARQGGISFLHLRNPSKAGQRKVN